MIKDLHMVSPESEGIRSEDILEFIKILEYHKINLHSFLMARNGNIIAEGYVPPFDKDFAHRIYSSTKTYVAMATGLLITEGKLKLTDKITDILVNYIDRDLHRWIRETTVEDCLTMSLPIGPMVTTPEEPHRACYNVLNLSKPEKPGGTLYKYNYGADLLAAVIKVVTGQEFIDYLRPVFDEIGVSKDIWCVQSAEDFCWGGSGIVCTLRDFAKFGEFVQNKALVNGKQMIDRSFMEKATSMQVFNLCGNNYTPLKTGGYGYLMWITPDAACFRGMGSQTCICFNKNNFMFVCQGDTQSDNDMHDVIIYDMVKYLVYDKIGEKKEEGEAYHNLQEKLKNLKPPMYGKPHADFEKEIDGKTYNLYENPMGWKNFRFNFSKDGKVGTITYENVRGVKTISFGMGELKKSTFPETHYYDKKRNEPSGRELDCLSVCEWVEEKKILLRVYITDTSFGNMFITFGFKGEEVGVCSNVRAEFLLEDYNGIAAGSLQKQ